MKHVLLQSLPSFGHIIPLLELAKTLSSHFKITFVISRGQMDELKKRNLISPEYASRIALFTLEDGISNNHDNEPSLTVLVQSLQRMEPALRVLYESITVAATNPVEPSLACGLDSQLPIAIDAVIFDMFINFPLEICQRRGLPCYIFSCSSALRLAELLRVTEDSPTASNDGFYKNEAWQKTTDTTSSLPRIPELFKKLALSIQNSIKFANGLLINSFQELEETTADGVRTKLADMGVPFYMVGPVNSTAVVENISFPCCENAQRIDQWLKTKTCCSVVYVSFGSMVALTALQLREIFAGLTMLKKPCIWSLRKDLQVLLSDQDQVAKMPDESFAGDLLILPWVNQRAILKNPVTAAFVSHSGWNSTLESVSYGVPIVSWPMFGDQHINANWIADRGIGVKIPQTGMVGVRIVPAEEICETIEKVLAIKEAGNQMEEHAFQKASRYWGKRAAAAISKGGSSHKDFNKFVKLL